MSESSDSDHPTRPSPPPQTWFPLAHPPPRSHSSRLRLSSRLLLQIQQLSPSPSAHAAAARAIPILELYQPSRLGKSVTDGRKLHSRDLYLTQSEPYTHLPTSKAGHQTPSKKLPPTNAGDAEKKPKRKSLSKAKLKHASEAAREHEDEDDNPSSSDVVAVIYTSPKRGEGGVPAELYFPGSRTVWEASISPRGGYRFQPRREKEPSDHEGGSASSSPSTVVLEWERRRPRSPPSGGAGAGASAGRSQLVSSPGLIREEENGDGDRFVLGIADPPLRRPWLAQLTKSGVQVGGWDQYQRDQLRLAIDEGAGLYTWILTMGVWIARQEGWLQ